MLQIKRNIIHYDDSSFPFEDLFSEEFYIYVNQQSHKYTNNTIYVNEIYNSFILPYLALKYYIEKNNIIKIDCSRADFHIKSLCIDLYSNFNHIRVIGNISPITKTLNKLKVLLLPLLSAIYLIYKLVLIPYKTSNFNKTIAVIRTKSGKSKMRNFDIPIEFEDYNRKTSIYRLTSISKRIKWILISYIQSFKEINVIDRIVKNYIGNNSSNLVTLYYSKRVVHTLLYYKTINNLFGKNSFDIFYTTNNLDRFSVIEEKLAKEYNIKSICIPHGLEYGFKLPKGFSCDLHYTNTLYAADYLNKLYETDKFVYDENIAVKMFKSNTTKKSNKGRVVYFSEPREVYVNQIIIEELSSLLKDKGIELFLKLHPKDKISDYEKYGLTIMTDLDDALSGNICISRKSTTLLEATYNDSVAAAILLNAKDKSMFYTFPSLQSERINVTNSIPELLNWIVNKYEIFIQA